MSKFITIHGHFYQPPRENPWLEAVEVQDSAAPYHDWNERITTECYMPNATSRILGSNGYIETLINNYARISFNFGPTLLSWLETARPNVYRAILEADKESQDRFGGHGSALAQCYNHIIMPLANRRDKITQILWGINDFRYRFGRNPEGMWLPETAADIETLDILAENGIKFTILAQHQARRVRKIGDSAWSDSTGGRVDPRRTYKVNLPSGRSLAVFFYDGAISQAVAFEDLLRDGANFARRILGGLDNRTESQLAHIATDGESYGHHHKFGDMALAFALQFIEKDKTAQLTNYGQYLEINPPQCETEIYENTAWSCAHGVERWQSDCGCSSGSHPGWHQRWRRPLREALNFLRDELAPIFENDASRLLRDPWLARNEYIEVILNRSQTTLISFLAKHQTHLLTTVEQTQAVKLLGMQRHLLLMFTSCGWFFDDIAGIETVQDLQYAARALQLAQEFGAVEVEKQFLQKLESSVGNRGEFLNGRVVWERMVKPVIVDLPKVVAHWALSGLFDNNHKMRDEAGGEKIYSFTVQRLYGEIHTAGRMKLSTGRAKVASLLTGEAGTFDYCGVHFGDHNMLGGVLQVDLTLASSEEHPMQPSTSSARFADILSAFNRSDMPEIVRYFDRIFGNATYSMRSIFKDGQRRILAQIMTETLDDIERQYREIYEDHAPTMRFLKDIIAPVPPTLQTAARFILNRDLKRVVESDEINLDNLRAMLRAIEDWGVELDKEEIGFALSNTLNRLAEEFKSVPDALVTLNCIDAAIDAAQMLPVHVSLYKAQTCCWLVGRNKYAKLAGKTQLDTPTKEWMRKFKGLADKLKVRI